jgi:CRP/FNR family transcriptional regulator
MDLVDIVRKSALGHHLNESELAQVAPLGQLVTYTVGEHLTELNDADADLFVLIEGRVQILTHDGDLLGSSGPGELVGEISFVDGRIRTAHAVATGLVRAIRFPARDLRALMVGNKEIGFKILANLCQVLTHRLRGAIGQLDELMDLRDDIWGV